MKVVDVQGTPNPEALKFVLDGQIVESGARSFEDPASGQKDALAAAVFGAGEVSSVFYMDRFVSVTKEPEANWEDLRPKVIQAIETAAPPALEEKQTAPHATADGHEETLTKIHKVIDEMVCPALAGDGGGLEVLDYSNFVLTVHYQGACGSCPSATMGTLYAIQNLLQKLVDQRIQVVSG
ncbi:MAG: NifU family protein [Elusimicrobia bacterium]|nr:NifU family protein [Elusimicrobiota bacterium]